MKDYITINVQIDIFKQKYEDEKRKYRKMGQIDMQSGEGNQSRRLMSELTGKITALKWVLGGY